MSIKLYNAYRTKTPVDIFELQDKIQTTGRAKLKNTLLGIYRDLTSNGGTIQHVTDYIHREYRSSLSLVYTTTYDFDSQVSVWKLGRRYYLYPIANGYAKASLAFLDEMPELEPYGYWDNTDRPDDITPRQWSIRRKVWHRILDKWHNNLRIDICNFHSFYLVDPFLELYRAEAQKARQVSNE